MEMSNPIIDQKDHPAYKKWAPIMAEWRESGLSAAEWVSQRTDITYDQFRNARRQWFPEDFTKRVGPVDRQTEWSALTVEIPSSNLDLYIRDCRIELASGFDQELLREVLEVIRRED